MPTQKTPAKVLKCGLVISQEVAILDGSPDARVVDFGTSTILEFAEVKCPETKYHVTPLEACKDPSFCCEAVIGHCKFKRDHAYFAQVQSQMGVILILLYTQRKEFLWKGLYLNLITGQN